LNEKVTDLIDQLAEFPDFKNPFFFALKMHTNTVSLPACLLLEVSKKNISTSDQRVPKFELN